MFQEDKALVKKMIDEAIAAAFAKYEAKAAPVKAAEAPIPAPAPSPDTVVVEETVSVPEGRRRR